MILRWMNMLNFSSNIFKGPLIALAKPFVLGSSKYMNASRL